MEGPLRELAADLGIAAHVTFTGRLSEIEKDRRLRQAHLLVHTSLREGWGLNVPGSQRGGHPPRWCTRWTAWSMPRCTNKPGW